MYWVSHLVTSIRLTALHSRYDGRTGHPAVDTPVTGMYSSLWYNSSDPVISTYIVNGTKSFLFQLNVRFCPNSRPCVSATPARVLRSGLVEAEHCSD
jgi:hypothetical protein